MFWNDFFAFFYDFLGCVTEKTATWTPLTPVMQGGFFCWVFLRVFMGFFGFFWVFSKPVFSGFYGFLWVFLIFWVFGIIFWVLGYPVALFTHELPQRPEREKKKKKKMGGRVASWTRNEFTDHREGVRKGVKCKHCALVIWSANGTRLRKHLNVCEKVPVEKKEQARAETLKLIDSGKITSRPKLMDVDVDEEDEDSDEVVELDTVGIKRSRVDDTVQQSKRRKGDATPSATPATPSAPLATPAATPAPQPAAKPAPKPAAKIAPSRQV